MAAVGVVPVAAGLVDHARVGDEWTRSKGARSLMEMLFEELGRTP